MPRVSRVNTGSVWSRRVAPLLALALGVIMLGFGVASVVLDHLTRQSGTGGPAADAFSTAAAVVPVAAVGTLLAARRPGNPIGWILLAIGLVDISPTGQYLVLDYRMHHGTLPLGWRRVQRAVDRRFNRSRYDAEAVVAVFTTRLRHTVDLDALRHDLVGVTHEAFQPAHVSMWLGPAPTVEQDRGIATAG
jgi:hypothetical protein